MNLTAILTKEMISSEGKGVTWDKIRDKVESDERIGAQVRISLYRNINSIINVNEEPSDYIARKEDKDQTLEKDRIITKDANGNTVTVASILSAQEEAFQSANEDLKQGNISKLK